MHKTTLQSYAYDYAYGMLQPNRHYTLSEEYKFGYQGSEMDNEINGTTGSMYTTFYRLLDTRIVQWKTPDPKGNLMPWESPYVSMGNNPILHNDTKGDTIYIYFISPDMSWTGFLGHNAIGVKLEGETIITYSNASGHAIYNDDAYIPNPNGQGGAREIRGKPNERKTVESYVAAGDIVYRYKLVLPKEVEENVKAFIGGNESEGFWCTCKVQATLKNSFMEAGYSKEEAWEKAKQIMPGWIPGSPSKEEISNAGYIAVDIFSQDENGKLTKKIIKYKGESAASTDNKEKLKKAVKNKL